MLSTPKRLCDTMKQPSKAGAVKIGIKTFDYPIESNRVNFNQFNGDPVYENETTTGIRACCAFDGSLIFFDGTTITRFANPNPNTDFTSLGEEGTMPEFVNAALFDIVADHNSAEVVAFKIVDNFLSYKLSSNNGVSWGEWTLVGIKTTTNRTITEDLDTSENIIDVSGYITAAPFYCQIDDEIILVNGWAGSYTQMYPCTRGALGTTAATHSNGTTIYRPTDFSGATFIRAAYDAYGDIIVLWRIGTNLYWWKRTDGVWANGGSANVPEDTDYFDLTYTYYTTSDQYPFTIYHSGARYAATVYNIEVRYDEDWFVILTWQQINWASNAKIPPRTQYRWAVYCGVIDGATLGWTNLGRVNVSGAKGLITGLSQLSNIGGSESQPLPSEVNINLLAEINEGRFSNQNFISLGKEYTVVDTAINTRGNVTENLTYPYAYLLKTPDDPIAMTIYDNDKLHIFSMREDMSVDDGTFSSAFSLTVPYPVNLCANDEYVFGYNGNQIYVWPRPYSWETPTAGSGAGAEYNPDASLILGMQDIVQDQAAQSIIIFNNHDYRFHNLTGDLAGLSNGSEIDIYRGYYDEATPVTSISNKVFIEQIDYARQPNLPVFKLRCVNAWRLLDRYTFPYPVHFNYLGATTTYTVYELIEMLINAIGGTLSYESRSNFITTFKPKVELPQSDTAANLLRRLIAICPDVIKFRGVDGIIVNPQTTDTSVATFIFPSRKTKEATFNSFVYNANPYNDGDKVYYPTIYYPAEYGNLPRLINRIVVIGMDNDGNLVIGQAQDETINGEMLNPYYENMADTSANAEIIAQNMLAKYRLLVSRGQITITPHPGLEMWDVIGLIDSDCNQSSLYRIAGMQFYYQSAILGQYRYEQILQLTSV